MSDSRPSSPPPADQALLIHLADRLRPSLLRLSRRLRREAERSGLSVMDVQLLAAVYKAPGVSASELADGEKISRPTMSAHVRRLEEAGWITRQAPAAQDDDRRRQALHATDAGLRVLDEVRRARTDWLVRRLAALDAHERARLAEAVPALLALLDEAAPSAAQEAPQEAPQGASMGETA